MKTRFLLSAVTTAILSVPAVAATPSAPAAIAPLHDLIAPLDIPFKTFTLDNGLRVVVHTDRRTPVVAVGVWYDVGSTSEPAGKTGFAHLFEHLMFNGTENVPGDFFAPLKAMGATDYNGTTYFDRTNSKRCRATRWSARFILRATAWAGCSAPSRSTCSMCSAGWSRTRSASATTSLMGSSRTVRWRLCTLKGILMRTIPSDR